MKIENILAKSDGCTLINHTKMTLNLGMAVASYLFRNNNAEYKDLDEVLKKLSIALILHDIGKCKEIIQKMIIKKSKKTTYHNIYSYSFFRHYIKGGILEENEPILISILYHHPIINENELNKDTGDFQFNENELKMMELFFDIMKNYASSNFGFNYENDFQFENIGISTAKISNEKLYREIKLDESLWRSTHRRESLKLLFRTCLIFSDRIVSSNKYDNNRILSNDVEYIRSKIIGPLIYCNKDNFNNIDILSLKDDKEKPLYEPKRLKNQIEVVDEIENRNINENNTMIINATAGFGKTLIGVLWALKSRRKTIWVTPRNAIAVSTCSSICSELSKIGENKIKVALYYSGEFKKGDENADILVTNIDSILYRNIKNNQQTLLFNVYTNNMIFDEFHEFKCGEALFSGFIRMLYTRKNYTSSKTMMLSATPLNFNCLYGNEHIETYNKSLQLYNSMKVNISVKQYDNLEDFEFNKDSFVILPFVSWAQQLYEPNKGNDIIHARYTDKDRAEKESILNYKYGKQSNIPDKTIVYGTMIIGVGLDISAKNIYDFFITPEDTIQRGCGRSGRFNEPEYEGYVNYNICQVESKLKTRNSRFKDRIKEEIGINLYNEWFETIKEYDGKQITKGDLYIIRDEFYIKNSKKMEKLYKDLFKESDISLCEFNITPSSNKKSGKQIIKKDNNYRNSSNKNSSDKNEIFVTVKDGNNEYIDAICINENIINEDDNDSDVCKKRRDYMLNNSNFNNNVLEYGYKMKKSKDFTVQNCKKFAYTNITPLLLLNASYNSDIGLIINH